MRIAIVGNGKMGRAVAALAAERGHTIHTVVDAGGKRGRPRAHPGAPRGRGGGGRVHPSRGGGRRTWAADRGGVPTVTGTTGWTAEMPRIDGTGRRAAWGIAPRRKLFRRGPPLPPRGAGTRASLRGRPEFDALRRSRSTTPPKSTLRLVPRSCSSSASARATAAGRSPSPRSGPARSRARTK